MWESIRCEVFNVTYEPLPTVRVSRAMNLVYKGKATILEEHPTLYVRTANDIHPVPIRIVLKKLVHVKNQHIPAQVNNRNLFVRDNFTCQYCGRHKSELGPNEMLTCDHIHPQDKGGKDVWLNVTTACGRCNNRKGNSLLSETNMRLLRPPRVITMFEIGNRSRERRH